MAYKSNARKEDEDIDEGFEDLSSSALHDIHYGHINQGFNGATSTDGDDLHPVSPNNVSNIAFVRGLRVALRTAPFYPCLESLLDPRPLAD